MRIMMSTVAVGILIGSMALAQTERAANVYPGTEYISGKDGFGQPVKGELVIEEQEITFKRKDGGTLFAIPMNSVVSVSNQVETDPGSFGRKVLLGVFASKREEFLTVKARARNGAEAIVFKAKKKTSDGMVAKVEFYLKNSASE